MNIDAVLTQLRAERDHLTQAIEALESVRARGNSQRQGSRAAGGKKRRRMSAEARKRISAAAKARWAAWRKQNKVA